MEKSISIRDLRDLLSDLNNELTEIGCLEGVVGAAALFVRALEHVCPEKTSDVVNRK